MAASDKKLAGAIGGKTARPCDSCIKTRARWYCPADDAFLCQPCDSLVHSANPSARIHRRVYLKATSLKLCFLEKSPPWWHQGFTKKPRTPRTNNCKNAFRRTPISEDGSMSFNPIQLVPATGSDETATVTSEERPGDKVPVFNPFASELNMATMDGEHQGSEVEESDRNYLNGLILPFDMELTEVAADVERLLGKEPFDCDSLVTCEDEGAKATVEGGGDDMGARVMKYEEECEAVGDHHVNTIDDSSNGNKRILKLDYEGIMAAWDDQRSFWTTGDRPEFATSACRPYCMGQCGATPHQPCMVMVTRNSMILDGGREAKVSRYREKRQARLFSKTIRYEVRKLNAEKRPRMKGRFVKRVDFVTNNSYGVCEQIIKVE